MSLTSDDLADIKQLMQGLLNQQMAQLDERFEAIDRRFEDIDRRFAEIVSRFDENAEVQNEILNAIG
ncbi:MAG: hypothetical protein Q4F02_03365, partial [Candidatus Saccharibacteria bacterium]|nr:hypothetical protein [Candidatus Saccharibacteria bacterium]